MSKQQEMRWCNGRCVTVGNLLEPQDMRGLDVQGSQVVYADPECPLHGKDDYGPPDGPWIDWDELFYQSLPDS